MAASSATGLELPSAQALQSTEQMKLLNAVDSLRAHGLGEILPLPQLVVCGDQSSGKSSVLEAISGVPFPRKANTCTRFATEVILRRARAVRMSVSIVPSQDLPRQDRERILEFRHELASIEDFADLFERAKETMGISDDNKTFSKDILRVEFWGPTQPQLTLVDLPGLIHSETKGQTEGDIKIVDDLVMSYLKSPASIILAIISAKYDLNNQVILRRARQVDPDCKRTLGIITKPDTIDNDEDEREFIKTARNENVRLALGWHVVKNLPSGSENAGAASRDEKETEFFNNSAFSVLPRQDVGIASLRTRLSNVLFEQIKVVLPHLVQNIENRVKVTREERNRLGPSRSTLGEQEGFLTGLSESFQIICRDAVAGHYDHDFFRDDVDGERRLCANLMNKHFEFAKSLRKRGALWKITQSEEAEDEDESEEELDEDREITREEAIEEAYKVLKRSRGRELPGLPNPLLVGELFREYSRPWADLARRHINDVWDTTNLFLDVVLQYLTDPEVCEKVRRHWLNQIMGESLALAEEKLNELLEVHKDHPLTTNPNFIDNRKNLQEKRSEEGRITDMDWVAAEDAFDNMNAYYQVAMNLFMDNVPTLAVQAPIVRKLPTMLSPSAVSKMDKEIIKNIAGESKEKIQKREETLRRLETLEAGARICKEYVTRPSSIPRHSEVSSYVATQQSPAEVRIEKGKSRNISSRRHSPSVSEDGRATSRKQTQTSELASSTRLGNTLNVPNATHTQRSASTDSSLGRQTASDNPTSGGKGGTKASWPPATNPAVFGQPSTPRGLFSATPTKASGVFGGSTETSTPSSATGLFGFGTSIASSAAALPAPDSTPKPTIYDYGSSTSKKTGPTSAPGFGGLGFGSGSTWKQNIFEKSDEWAYGSNQTK